MTLAKLKNLVGEAVSIDGLGVATYLGAMRGHITFAAGYVAELTSGDVLDVPVKFEEFDEYGRIVQFEHSRCNITASGIERVTCAQSSNNNAFVVFDAGKIQRAFVFAAVEDLGGGAFSGSYDDLTDKPTLGTAAALNVAASGNASSSQIVKGDDTRLGAGSMAIGGAVTGATANKGLHADADGNLAQSAMDFGNANATLLVPHVSTTKATAQFGGVGFANKDGDAATPVLMLNCRYDGSSYRSLAAGGGWVLTCFYGTLFFSQFQANTPGDVVSFTGSIIFNSFAGITAKSISLTAIAATDIYMTPYTVGTLPTPTAGRLAFVNDASATTKDTAPVGGGANKRLVQADGAGWLIV